MNQLLLILLNQCPNCPSDQSVFCLAVVLWDVMRQPPGAGTHSGSQITQRDGMSAIFAVRARLYIHVAAAVCQLQRGQETNQSDFAWSLLGKIAGCRAACGLQIWWQCIISNMCRSWFFKYIEMCKPNVAWHFGQFRCCLFDRWSATWCNLPTICDFFGEHLQE